MIRDVGPHRVKSVLGPSCLRESSSSVGAIFISFYGSIAMKFLLNRISILHRKLDTEINRESKRRPQDFLRLMHLKKVRLALRDKIARLTRPSLVKSSS